MELIKKIKQAEAQSQEIIEQAKAEAAKQVEKGRDWPQQAYVNTSIAAVRTYLGIKATM